MLVATLALALSLTVGQKPSFDARASDMGLLQFAAVQKELKLSVDQISNIDKAEKEFRSEAKRTHSWNSEKGRVAVAKYLSDSQLKRLREISMQKAGPIVLIVDFVDERLGMSSERHKEIQGVFNSAINEALKPMQKEIEKAVQEEMRTAGDNPDEIEKRSERASKRAEEISSKVDHESIHINAAKKILDSLTPSERKAWKDLQGAPFPVEQLKDKDEDEDGD